MSSRSDELDEVHTVGREDAGPTAGLRGPPSPDPEAQHLGISTGIRPAQDDRRRGERHPPTGGGTHSAGVAGHHHRRASGTRRREQPVEAPLVTGPARGLDEYKRPTGRTRGSSRLRCAGAGGHLAAAEKELVSTAVDRTNQRPDRGEYALTNLGVRRHDDEIVLGSEFHSDHLAPPPTADASSTSGASRT